MDQSCLLKWLFVDFRKKHSVLKPNVTSSKLDLLLRHNEWHLLSKNIPKVKNDKKKETIPSCDVFVTFNNVACSDIHVWK
jgi:hypothetical protein